jgi:hypothetical protein
MYGFQSRHVTQAHARSANEDRRALIPEHNQRPQYCIQRAQGLLKQHRELESIAEATRADLAALQGACAEAAAQEENLQRQLNALQVLRVAAERPGTQRLAVVILVLKEEQVAASLLRT